MKLFSPISYVLLGVLSCGVSQAAGDVERGKEKSQVCVSCHGPDGNSIAPTFPRIAGQVPGYIAKQLARFKSGERENAIMAGIVQPLSEEDMVDLDAYYSAQSPQAGSITEAERELAEEGADLYRGGYAQTQIAPCMSCHGPNGHGIPPHFPRVAGQFREYAVQQLLAFKTGTRVSHGNIMTQIAFLMSERQIQAVAAHMQALQ
ncbi:MAG: cytochrome c4 [Gammaproteobacteria bacterium]|nr:cytochrome c4 [Gammaproteobacteria bacterium]